MSPSRTYIAAFCAIALMVLLALIVATPAGAKAETNGSRETASREATFNVYVSDANKTQTVNETTYVAFFSISLENKGDSLGDVVMYMTGFPNTEWDWQPNPGGEDHKIESMWPLEIKWVTIVIYAPLTEKAGEYNLYLEVKPGGPQNEIMLKARIPQKGGVEVTPPNNIEKEPGVVLELPFQIRNSGNGEDTYKITRVDISKPDWDVYVVGGFETGKVKPLTTTTKIVKVTVPYEAEATQEGKPGVRVSITVQSKFDTGKEDARGCYIKVLQFWRVIFNVDKANVTTRPNERVEFTMIVRNDGNGNDNITVTMEHSLEDWSIGLSQTWFNLTKDTGRSATLSIIPSERALKGDYWITINALSQGPPDSPDEVSRTILVTVEEVFSINMTVAQNVSAPMPPGGVAEFPFMVTNYGNTNDYVTLTVEGAKDGWFVSLDSEGVPLGPGQKKEVTLTVLASPRLEESPAQKYYFSVKGVSDGLPDLIQWVNVTTTVTAVGRIDVNVAGDDTITVNPYQKENYNFIFDVTNKGNEMDEIHLTISSMSWDPNTIRIKPVFYPNIMNVPRYQTKQARMEVTVPRGTPLGYYDMTIVGTSTLNPMSTKTLVTHVKVIQEDVQVQAMRFKKASEPSTMFRGWKQYKVEEGGTIHLAIPVFNNGSEIVHNVNLKVYQDGKVIYEDNITSMGLLKTVIKYFTWKASFLGNFKMKAVVTISGDSNQADNMVEAEVKVVEKTTVGPGGPGTSNVLSLAPGSPLFILLVIIVVIGILAAVRHILNLRAEQNTRDLYESIYGDEVGGTGPQEQAGSPDYKELDKGGK